MASAWHHPDIGRFEDLTRALYLEKSFTHVYMAFGLKTRPLEMIETFRRAFAQIRGVMEPWIR